MWCWIASGRPRDLHGVRDGKWTESAEGKETSAESENPLTIIPGQIQGIAQSSKETASIGEDVLLCRCLRKTADC